MARTQSRQFFVYVYRSPDGSPFYVGKGLRSRISQRGNRSPEFLAYLAALVAQGLEPIVDVEPQPDEATAYLRERELIALYGRSNIGTGSLVNKTSGGEGMRDVWLSDEDRERARVQMAALKANRAVEAKRVARLRAIQKDPVYIENRRKGQKRRQERPEQREANLSQLASMHEDVAIQARRASSIAASWDDEAARAARLAGMKKAMESGGARRRSQSVKAIFDGPLGDARRARIADAARSRWADTAYRDRVSESCKAAFSDPERAKKHKAKILLNWEKRHLAAGRTEKAAASRAAAESIFAAP